MAAGSISDGRCELTVVHRFANGPVLRSGRLRWDMAKIFSEVLVGLRRLHEEFPSVESIGIDGWGVDVALLDSNGELVADPISYRDGRCASFVDSVHDVISRSELFALNGLQFLPFTTLYQLAAARTEASWERVFHVVLLPDLIGYWLTGVLGTEITNASTTGLLRADAVVWCDRILAAVGLEPGMFPPLRNSGVRLGRITDFVAANTGLASTVEVMTVASHDTASAVVAIPSLAPEFVFVSSGTWSLVGTEVDRPFVTPTVMSENFTNERGVDGRFRLIRNVGGLWLLQECLRAWRANGEDVDLMLLLEAATELPHGPEIDVDDPDLVAPGDMPGRIRAAVTARDQAPPQTKPEMVRCILDSLAITYASTVKMTLELTNRSISTLHVVGGGSQNELLCQLTANATGTSVLAGPAEATALGNVMVQARARGAAPSDLGLLRQQMAEHGDLVLYRPQAAPARSDSP